MFYHFHSYFFILFHAEKVFFCAKQSFKNPERTTFNSFSCRTGSGSVNTGYPISEKKQRMRKQKYSLLSCMRMIQELSALSGAGLAFCYCKMLPSLPICAISGISWWFLMPDAYSPLWGFWLKLSTAWMLVQYFSTWASLSSQWMLSSLVRCINSLHHIAAASCGLLQLYCL